MRKVLGIIVLLALAAGCARMGDEARRPGKIATAVDAGTTLTAAAALSETPVPPAAPSTRSEIASTATGTARPTLTPTASVTPTSTATPTPTPTALPMTVSGNPRAAALQEPEASEDAVCGLVDLLDFPLDAPHARDARGGGNDFAIFRRRFDGYHTGEDWWASGGRQSSLGAAVYSIGHGQVTYAEPLGWGRDKGIVIVRHTFADGSQLLSFYGHLDEDSLKVEAGDCVARGEQIAEVGHPTTSPHLHFELRTVMPYAPGRGYLPDDPGLAGYLEPSVTIWDSRMAVSPGVLWTRPVSSDGTALLPGARSVAAPGEEIIVVLGEEYIAGINTADGSERWRLAVSKKVEEMLLDDDSRQFYTANQFGEVSAFALPVTENGAGGGRAQPLWTVDVDAVGIPVLMPLPGGGLILSAWDQLAAISAEGKLLWEADLGTRPFDWLISGDTLFISASGGEQPLWTANADGLQRLDVDAASRPAAAGGKLAAAGDNVLFYDGNALYRLALENQPAAGAVVALLREPPLLTLRGGRVAMGALAALPNGGAVLAHVDRNDRRLIALDGRGDVLWERSIGEISTGTLDLVVDGDDIFLAARNPGGSGSELLLFALDLEEARLTHLLTGGTRSSALDQTRLFQPGNGRLLISIDGCSLTMLDTKEAERTASSKQ